MSPSDPPSIVPRSPPPTPKQSKHPEAESAYNEFQESMEKLRERTQKVAEIRKKARSDAPDEIFNDDEITGVTVIPSPDEEDTKP